MPIIYNVNPKATIKKNVKKKEKEQSWRYKVTKEVKWNTKTINIKTEKRKKKKDGLYKQKSSKIRV